MTRYLIGIDLGTTNAKGILFDEGGNSVASAASSHRTYYPHHRWAEQNPNEWWNGICEILQSITTEVGPEISSNIKGLCISSQTPTLLPVDEKGKPIRNAIIWMDSRSKKIFENLMETVDKAKYKSIVGGEPDVTFLPSKLIWYRENEPENFAKTHKILQASSYINFKLTGEFSADLEQATLSQCLDTTTLEWSDYISEITGCDIKSLMPKAVPNNTITGFVTESASEKTGLPVGMPVMAGTTDSMAAMYAVGLCKPGQAAEISGTSSLVFAGHTAQTDFNRPVISKACSIPGMPYVFDAPISCTGACINWYIDTIGRSYKDACTNLGINIYNTLNNMALDVPAGSNGVIFFPYMMGERAPLWNSYAKGMFIGMSLKTTNDDLLRAVFEGTGYSLRHVIQEIKDAGADVTSMRIAGGGAKSKGWLKIKASILNLPIQILSDKTGDVPFGDVLIAGSAVGIYPDLAKAMNELIEVKETICPDPEWAKAYDEIYPFYRSMYEALAPELKKYENVCK